MEPQTYSLLTVLASAESAELLIALLDEPARVEELARRVGLSSPTASRRLDNLALAGVVARSSPRAPFEVAAPEETRHLLEAISDLATAIIEQRKVAEQGFRRRVQKTRLHAESGGAEAS